ncbi:acyl-oxidase [Moniliophthora roreri]|nr:acyl-oxidase [Moniliophthora roreri]
MYYTGLRGGAIAEGDVLVTSIRFGIEIITRRIQSPPTTDPTSLLYRYEQAVIAALRQLLSCASSHGDPEFERHTLP